MRKHTHDAFILICLHTTYNAEHDILEVALQVHGEHR